MFNKDKGVSVKVSKDFYKMMEITRIKFKNRHGIKIGSHIKLTNMWSKNPKIFQNKKWVKIAKNGII